MINAPRLIVATATLLMHGCGATFSERVSQFNRDGVARLLAGDYIEAEAQFRQALALAPQDRNALYNLAVVAHRQSRFAEAEDHYRRCLSVDPNFLPARRGLANVLWQQGRQEELRQFVDEWRKTRPSSADALALYGWYLMRQGDYPAAEAALDQALALDPQNAFALAERGRLYEIYRYPDRARSLYERSLHCDPWQPELQAHLTSLPRTN